MNKALKTVGNNKGFTLLEFVVVVALAAVVMVATAMLITKGKESAAFSSVKDNIQIIGGARREKGIQSKNAPRRDLIHNVAH
ncbi:MAG TPA: prepilin-type N-terminal cleavage/methylation domain-containing protein [Spirochaetota bacterium]|nr:prepilin-type N-terminal cleavage/methylation domain-containing protein [Spirochaetota bacterium]